MNTAVAIIAVILGIIGIIGSVVPGLPGPPLSWVGMLLLYFRKGTDSAGDPMSLTLLIVMLIVMVAVTVIDYVIPASMTKMTGGSKYASRGSMAGLIAGIFLTPIGMIGGAFLGALLAELIWGGKDLPSSAKAALGAFLGFLTGTGIKLITSGIMMWLIIVYI